MDSILGDGFDVCVRPKIGKVIQVDSYSSTGWLNHQLSSDQKPWEFAVYRGLYHYTYMGIFYQALIRIPVNQAECNGKYPRVFFSWEGSRGFNPPRSPSKGDIPK